MTQGQNEGHYCYSNEWISKSRGELTFSYNHKNKAFLAKHPRLLHHNKETLKVKTTNQLVMKRRSKSGRGQV